MTRTVLLSAVALATLVAAAPVEAKQFCPPGLAKKSPACIPPGQAKKMHRYDDRRDDDDRHHYRYGDRYDDHDDGYRHDRYYDEGGYRDGGRFIRIGDSIYDRDYHLITRPGLYGLEPPRDGWGYYIVDGNLLRVDQDTYEVLDLIRAVDAILD
ncbi:excinuclease ABC subunit A [Ostreiculturibacter nitratireducens]|uniref:excinuclease ABC subunit A n=1 Tax=Ostreiculturibacter nitratireducens TaxID=3075226 RepID=UPI0031B5CAFC